MSIVHLFIEFLFDVKAPYAARNDEDQRGTGIVLHDRFPFNTLELMTIRKQTSGNQIPSSVQHRKEKSSVQLYRALDKKRLGVALHIPQPNAQLSRAARIHGVGIGSVGKVTPERSFDCMLNICHNPLDPVNPPDLQAHNLTSIQPPFDGHDIRIFKEFSSGSYLATPGIYETELEGTPLR